MNLTVLLRAWPLEAPTAASFLEFSESSSPAGMYVESMGEPFLGDRIHRLHVAYSCKALGSYWDAERDKKAAEKEG